METEKEKMWQPKTTTVSVIVEDLGIIKKETDKRINKIHGSPYLYDIQKLLLMELII